MNGDVDQNAPGKRDSLDARDSQDARGAQVANAARGSQAAESAQKSGQAQTYPPDKRRIKLKHRALSHVYPHKPLANALLHALHAWLRTSNAPGINSKTHPLIKPKNNRFVNVPVNLELPFENATLPLDVIHDLIDRSAYIHVMDHCVCRTGKACKHHRSDIGCMFLGASGNDIVPPISHPVTREQAYAHVDAALADGLVPQTMRLRADNYAFLFPDHHAIVAICFCCDCCCFMGYYKDVPRDYVTPIYKTVPGARVAFDSSKCLTCGAHECAKHCYMKNISFDEKGAMQFGPDCKACGRCATYCPNGAVRFFTDDPHALDKVEEEFLALADLEGDGSGWSPQKPCV